MTNKCRIPGCGSHAINPGHYGRPEHKKNIDHDLCDVHFWKERHDKYKKALENIISIGPYASSKDLVEIADSVVNPE